MLSPRKRLHHGNTDFFLFTAAVNSRPLIHGAFGIVPLLIIIARIYREHQHIYRCFIQYLLNRDKGAGGQFINTVCKPIVNIICSQLCKLPLNAAPNRFPICAPSISSRSIIGAKMDLVKHLFSHCASVPPLTGSITMTDLPCFTATS